MLREVKGSVTHLDERERLVELLKAALQKAEAGELNGIAMATSRVDGSIGTAFDGARTGNVWVLVGATANLLKRLLDSTDEGEPEP